MRQCEVFVIEPGRNKDIPVEGHEQEKQMQRIVGRRQHFTREGPAAKGVWIPKRYTAVPEGVDPEVQPTVVVVSRFGADYPGELISKKRLPKEKSGRQ